MFLLESACKLPDMQGEVWGKGGNAPPDFLGSPQKILLTMKIIKILIIK